MSIMVVLKNINRGNDYIEAEYFPDNSSKKGFMRIRVSDSVVVEHQNASMTSAPHVKKELLKLLSQKKIPKQKTVLWY